MEDCSTYFHLKYLERYSNIKPGEVYPTPPTPEQIQDAIEFTKLHVRAALKAASENARLEYDHHDDMAAYINKHSVINSYPLENIK